MEVLASMCRIFGKLDNRWNSTEFACKVEKAQQQMNSQDCIWKMDGVKEIKTHWTWEIESSHGDSST